MATSKREANFWSTTLPDPTSPAYSQRRILSSCVLGTFLFAFLFLAVSSLDGDRFQWLGLWNFCSGQKPILSSQLTCWQTATEQHTTLDDEDVDVSRNRKADEAHYGQYVWHDRLEEWKSMSSGGRLIFIGDVHGMVDSLKELLDSIKYSGSRDQLVFVGDLVAKSGLSESLDTISYIRQLKNVKSVRGNHDQHVIGWRAWMEIAKANLQENVELHDWDLLSSKKKSKDLPSYPDSWEWGGEHFAIAKSLSKEDWNWYKSLPLSIYVPDLKAYVVHAGMLSTLAPIEDFELPSVSSTEYLNALTKEQNSTLSSLSDEIFLPSPKQAKTLKSDPKTAVLMQLQNRDPWTLLDMRGVRHHGSEPTRKVKGDKWFELWNEDMEHCEEDEKCLKQNIIYGHWAGEGLTLKDHTFGLDTGCVYGRSLTALIMNDTSDVRERGKKKPNTVQVNGQAGTVVQIPCNT